MAIFGKKTQESLKADLELEPEIQPLEKPAQSESGHEALPVREKESSASETEPPVQEDSESKAPIAPTKLQQSTTAPLIKSEHLQHIEQILEEDLGEAYDAMDVQHQQMFKRAGEDSARQIEGMLGQAKVKVQKIFELIKIWLTMIPGVNKWFIVQESKIKTDKLTHLNKKS